MELPVMRRILRACIGLFAMFAANTALPAIGRTPGFASVSADGEANYTIPIALPPGTNGMTPALSLEYRHRSRGGLLGVGRSIGGLSQITRCAKTVAQDGVASAPLRTVADRFCLDGQRLVVVGQADYQAPGAEYRTEIESFARIRAIPGTSTNGPASFTVEGADGRIYEYGATNDSRIDGTPGPSTNGARAWALNQIRDRAGNVIDYRYTEESGSTAFRIAGIRYNANPAAGIPASHEVAFIFESRPGPEIDAGFVVGMPVRQALRLDRIDVLYNGALFGRYDLGYQPTPSSGGRSRLASVTECGGGGTDCFPPTTFEWQDGGDGVTDATTFPALVPAAPLLAAGQAWNVFDIDGDGRDDVLWAGGPEASSATIRYRLSRVVGGFGPAIDSGIPCPHGIGAPFDANGDGRGDLLMVSSSANWAIARGSATGLAAPINTGIPAPAGTRDFRGADVNGDGLGDIAWTESDAPNTALRVRVRLGQATGGFAGPVTLYTQANVFDFADAEPGDFVGRPGRRIDFDADGAEDLLVNDNAAIVRVSRMGHANELFAYPLPRGIALDFNDDDCTDYAYKHISGSLRARAGECSLGASALELAGPAWAGHYELHAHDWNGDGRDDILLRGAVNWQVAISHGDGFAPIADTGVPHEDAFSITGRDLNGDGLQDLALRTQGQLRVRFAAGDLPDLLLSATDGQDVTARFEYRPLTDGAIHVAGTGASYPAQELRTGEPVVARLTMTDGSGDGNLASTGYRYEGLRRDLRGRGSLGFRKVTQTDLTSAQPLAMETTRRQDFPFTGLPESVIVRQASGSTVSATEYQWSKLEYASQFHARSYPYPTTILTRGYGVGGASNGSEITRSIRSVAAIDAASGLVTDETTTTTEISGGSNAGSSASIRTLHSSILNDTANWCLGRSLSVQLTASHTLLGGAPITRTADQVWSAENCRPTRIRLQPGDAAWQVTNDLAYDDFGNLVSEKVTGAGMAARTVTTSWGARGQLPQRITDPLGKERRFTWDEARSLPLMLTDPNGASLSWTYDSLGRLTRETQPDGTSATWTRVVCKSQCDVRAKFRVRQDDIDGGGITRITSWFDVDQHDRGVRFATQAPGGGRSVSSFGFDDRGRVTWRTLPQWDGDLAPGRWQFSYDIVGRQTGEQLVAAGGTVERSSSLIYDGLAVTKTNPLGHSMTATRDVSGRIAEVVDALGGRTRYEYDAFGGLSRVRDAMNNSVARIDYNARGMKVAVDDLDRGAWTWSRNALGETTSLRDAKGQLVRFEYDPLGRITKRIAPDGTSTWKWGSVAARHEIGRLAAIIGPGYSESFTYDGIGRPVTHTIVADTSYRFDFAYNSLGLLGTLAYPSTGAGASFRVRHEYDAGRVSRIRNAASTSDTYWALNAQDAAGNALDEMLGSSVRVISGFSPLDGNLEYRQSSAGSTSVQDLAYAWDRNGNLSQRQDLSQGLLEELRYDALDRLEQTRRNGAVDLTLGYDAIGNILRKSDVCPGTVACYGYHAARRHAVISAGVRTYAYDANGNMTNRDGAAITWSSDNLPLAITHANGNDSRFSYGPDGNRWQQVAKQGNASTTTIYAGGLFEKVVQGGVTTWRHYLPAPGGVAVHLRYSDGTPPSMRFLTLDHLGSTDRIVDASGNVVIAESFGAFGARRRPLWTGVPTAAELAKIAAVTRDGFTGHEHLDNLGLIHMNGRVYDPSLGRFLSADPYVTRPFDGQGLNRYSYVLNNPLAFGDPSGYDPVPCLANQSGNCVQIVVIATSMADYMRSFGGAQSAEIASALERDPCGQNGNALACALGGSTPAPPSTIVLTVGRHPDSTLSTGGRLDAFQGFAARIANLAISSSPIALLFGADPDFQYFRVPGSEAGRNGAAAGSIGYFLGGAAGIIRKGGSEIAQTPSAFARSLQGNAEFPGIDRFKDIVLKKGKIIYSGYPGQGHFYTTRSAIDRIGNSSAAFNRGLQIAPHRIRPPRGRYAAYEVVEDTQAAFALTIANPQFGPGWLPQIVVPSYRNSLQLLYDYPLGP
jgi:RHS repeat-associated protein